MSHGYLIYLTSDAILLKIYLYLVKPQGNFTEVEGHRETTYHSWIIIDAKTCRSQERASIFPCHLSVVERSRLNEEPHPVTSALEE